MFEKLSRRLNASFKDIKYKGKINNNNIKNVIEKIKISLLDSDVPIKIIEKIINNLKNKTLEKNITKSLIPEKMLKNILKDEISEILGKNKKNINLKQRLPIIIMLVGLQGSGKTTTSAKIGRLLRKKYKKK